MPAYQNHDPFRIPFVINETPYCLSGWVLQGSEVSEQNRRYIGNIDPDYFGHIATVVGGQLDGEGKDCAATLLRQAYSQGLETLFALLSATVQAPDCVLGWMLKYQKSELDSVVRKIHEQRPLLSRTDEERLSWELIAALVLRHSSTGDEDRDARLVEGFANLWRGFAADFLNESVTAEYNSLRHGYIVMRGEYGSSFYGAQPMDRHNFRISYQSVNWDPVKCRRALWLIASSIGNTVSCLKILNGAEPGSVRFIYPEDEAFVQTTGIFTDSLNHSPVETGWVAPLKAEEIRAAYKKTDKV